MIRFEHPELFYLYLLVPILVLVFLISRYLRERNLRAFGQESLVRKMSPLLSDKRPYIKFLLVLIAVSSIVMGLANPQTGSRMEEVHIKGADIIIALDVSRSMFAQDMRPNRLERAKLAVNRLIDRLDQDRIGIVLFAGTAQSQVPLTTDHNAAKMILRTANTNSVPVQGTAIELAIERSLLALQDDKMHNKAIIIISDGESHEDEPLQAARRAAEKGVVIHTIGIGSLKGAPIPIEENGRITGYLRDQEGNTVISRYNEQMLREIAEITGGVFRHGAGADIGLDEILEQIRTLEQETHDTVLFAEYESRYQVFVALALLLLVADLIILERKNKYLAKINIFGS